MKSFFTLFVVELLICFCKNTCVCSQPVVSNIRLQADKQFIRISYDISGVSSPDSVYLLIDSQSRGTLTPKTLSGDIGKSVTSGKSRLIIWEFSRDTESLTGLIRPIIGVVEIKQPLTTLGGGPTNALISALAPGVGNIFVQPQHKIGLRPIITITYASLIAFAILQRAESKKQYELYMTEPFEFNAQTYYNKANNLRHQYLLTGRVAGAILIADVLYTFIKGLHNNRLRQKSTSKMTFGSIGHTPTVGLHLTF